MQCSACFGALLVTAATSFAAPEGPVLSLEPLDTNNFKVRATNVISTFVRLDSTENLIDWFPLDILPGVNGALEFAETSSAEHRFFRTVEVSPGLALEMPEGGAVRAGEILNVYGQFFAREAPGDNVLRLGGIDIDVISATGARLSGKVPANATSGPLTLTTPEGTVTLASHVLVIGDSEAELHPAAGFSAADFTLGNVYGMADSRLTVRRGVPLLNFALPRDGSPRGMLLAVSQNDGPLIFDENSTAIALVFLHPSFSTIDPYVAGRTLSRLAGDAKVQALGKLYASELAVGLNPFTTQEFADTYAAALIAAAAPLIGEGRISSLATRQVFDSTGLQFITISGAPGQPPVVSSIPNNPFDWAVVIGQVDVEKVFKLGNRDYQDMISGRGNFPNGLLTSLNTVSGTTRQFVVKARFATEQYDLPAKIVQALKEKLGFKKDEGQKLDGLENDALYIVRAISPAFTPDAERVFVEKHYDNPLFRAQALNVAHLMLDSVGILVDLSVVDKKAGDVLAIAKRVEKIYAKVLAAQPLNSVEKWKSLIIDLGKDFASDAFDKEATALVKGGLAALFDFVGDQINILGKLKNAENVLERTINGLTFATPLETGFIELGNPFGFKVLGVEPAGGSVGDTVTNTVSGNYFGRSPEEDKVLFAGRVPAAFRVVTVSDNEQNVICEVPRGLLDLEPILRTNPVLTVIAAGRRADGLFNFVERPTIERMTPAEGFAAADYLGSAFIGTSVHLQGFGFGPDDRYFFGGIEATNKSGAQGDMVVPVPAGAGSGPIKVIRDFGTPQERFGLSPEFKVFGPPVIARHGPDSGPVGTTVHLLAENLGTGPAMLLLNDQAVGEVRLAGDRIAGIIPFAAVSGPFRVVTPAGEAEFDFSVTEGLAQGGVIDVGGPSVVTLERAFEFIAGDKTPPWSKGCAPGLDCVDDEDIRRDEFGNPLENLDGPDHPLEEGDFMTDNGTLADPPRFPFGRLFRDAVAITNTIEGNFTISTNSSFDLILGAADGKATIKGQLVVQGSHCTLVNLTVQGQLRVEGNDNEINVRVIQSPNDGVVITGNGNKLHVECISNTYDGLVIDGGQLNQVEVRASGNLNGVTLKGGAVGNRVSVTTGSRNPINGRGLPKSGNKGHGIQLVGSATNNLIVGIDVIAGNGADGIYMSGFGVVKNELAILDSTGNGGNGFTVRDGANNNSLQNLVAQGNGADGFDLLGGKNNLVLNLRTGDNASYGLRASSVVDTNGFLAFDARSNRVAALRVDGGTRGVEMHGTSLGDNNGLQVVGPDTTGNLIQMQIRSSTAEGALIQGATTNKLRLDMSGCGSSGLVLEQGAAENDLRDLRVNACGSHGVLVKDAGTRANHFPNAAIGIPLLPDEKVGNNGDGFRIEAGATANQIGAIGEGCAIQNNAGAGVRITGGQTQGNFVVFSRINETPSGYIQAKGVVVADGAINTSISDNTITGHSDAGVEIADTPGIILGPELTLPNSNKIQSNGTGIRLTGKATVQTHIYSHDLGGNSVGIHLTDGANANQIGTGITIHDGVTGIWLDGANNNRIQENDIHENTGSGIRADNGASQNVIVTNKITLNAVGVEINGPATLRNTITVNAITANAGLGIRLLNGGNRQLPAPVITSIGSQRLYGTSEAPGSSTIELFSDPADEGETLIDQPDGGRLVVNDQFVVPVDLSPKAVGSLFNLHATVTDPDGNTSEFGGTGSGSEGTSPIVFTSTRDGNKEIYLTDNFGASATRLTDHSAADYQPAVAPDETQIAFVSERDGNAEIYLLQNDVLTRLTSDPSADTEPAWSPDGTKIAFVSKRSGNSEIFVMNTDGSSVTQLTTDSHNARSPAWSPDGTTIAFVSDRDGTDAIWLMNADGSNPHAIASAAGTSPAWSPDGARLALVSSRDGNPEIYTMRADGSDVQRVTDDPGIDVDPAWLPNSTTLVFASNRSGGFELYLVSMSGSSPERITISTGDNIEPSTR